MNRIFRIVSAMWLLVAAIGCGKVSDGNDSSGNDGNDPEVPSFERYVKGKYFKSVILGNERINYSVYLPADYESNTDQRYPVVYFLHGYGESSTKDWTKYMNVIDNLETGSGLQSMIYVFPNGFNSYYCNAYDGSFDYMDMFIEELVPYIDENYRTVADRRHRGIMGYSMGGFGAMALAMKHPEVFGMSAPMSMSFRTDEQYMQESQNGWNNQWGSIFGGVGQSGEGRLTDYYKAHCPYYQFTEENKDALSEVKWFFHCGDDEEQLLIANSGLHVQLCDNGYEHEFRISDGAHTSSYWISAEREILPWMAHIMNNGGEWTRAMGTVTVKSSEINEDGTFTSKAYKEAAEKNGKATYMVHNGLSKDIIDKCICLLTQYGSSFQYVILPCDLSVKSLEEWIVDYSKVYEAGKSTDKSQVFAIGDVGSQVWTIRDRFCNFYLINASLNAQGSVNPVTADADKFYYIETTDDGPYYKDAHELYVSCKATGADFEYRMRNGLPDDETELLLAVSNAASKFRY